MSAEYAARDPSEARLIGEAVSRGRIPFGLVVIFASSSPRTYSPQECAAAKAELRARVAAARAARVGARVPTDADARAAKAVLPAATPNVPTFIGAIRTESAFLGGAPGFHPAFATVDRELVVRDAQHEAGHAVAHFLAGHRIDRVTILRDGAERGHVLVQVPTNGDAASLRAQLVAALAGPAAVRALSRDVRDDGGHGDRVRAAELAGRIAKATGGNARAIESDGERAAVALFAAFANRDAVRAVAVELLRHGTLSGDAAREVLRRALGAESAR